MDDQLFETDYSRVINDLCGLAVITPLANAVNWVCSCTTGESADHVRYTLEFFTICLSAPKAPTRIVERF